ncbi:M4 family metallopeptidase [Actinomadura graeca]|uniref:Neutral metalloproteinase n=1 Tax=Actinomadura graeca TaxID=2750812 RepID=A0ABX8QY92_9ACTN|nr:M4 family metallopeptidase [Actinomadura graeca]QXJ22422.1 M4 family metallopeptidase [Actinomadura graeca]
MRHQTALGAAAITAGLAVAMSAPIAGANASPAAPPTPSPLAAVASADRLVSAGQAHIHTSPKDKIIRQRVLAGAGGLQYVSYERTYAGLPVRGGDFVVATDAAGNVLSTAVNQTTELSVGTAPKVTAARAAAIARKQIDKPGTVSTPTLTVLAEGKGRLVYETVVQGLHRPPGSYGIAGPGGSYGVAGPGGSYGVAPPDGSYGVAPPDGSYGVAPPDGSYGVAPPDGSYGLAAAERPSKMHVLVDARSGKVVRTWDEVVDADDDQSFYHGGRDKPTNIVTSGSGNSFTMNDATRPGVSCGDQNGAPFTGTDDAWGSAVGTDLETACVDAMKGAQAEWDMVKTWLDRNGLDGNGRGWPMRVGLNQANAFWNGQFANFGRNQSNNKQATPTDVVAHELGHGIFQNTPGGSGSGNEAGGLNESTGDIFGALTEWFLKEPKVAEQINGATAVVNFDPPDYEVGEELDLVGRGPIRNMADPSKVGNNPGCFSASVPRQEVHAAAGVQNHWFYLLAEGSNANDADNGRPNSPTCDNSQIKGIGIQKAGRIFMETLNMKTSGWTHGAARKTSLTAALNLVKAGKVTCADFTATKDAWNAVSVPAASGEPTTCTG